MIDPKTGKRRVLVLDTLPDEDGFDRQVLMLEEWLFLLRRWEGEHADMELPEPVAGGGALTAVERVPEACRAVTGQRALDAGWTGSQYSQVVDRSWGSLAGSVEVAPVRIVLIDQDEVEVCAGVARTVKARADDDIRDAADQIGEAEFGVTGEQLLATAGRLHAVLSEPWDDDVRGLVDRIAAAAPGEDVEFTAAQARAYRHVAWTFLRATGGDGLDAFAAGAFE